MSARYQQSVSECISRPRLSLVVIRSINTEYLIDLMQPEVFVPEMLGADSKNDYTWRRRQTAHKCDAVYFSGTAGSDRLMVIIKVYSELQRGEDNTRESTVISNGPITV